MTNRKTFILWLIFVIFLAGTIFSTIEISSLGGTLANLQKQSLNIASENENLNRELVKFSSLNSLSLASQNLGFIKAQNIVYLSGQGPVANANAH